MIKLPLALTSCLAGTLLFAACGNAPTGGTPGTGGSTAQGGSAGASATGGGGSPAASGGTGGDTTPPETGGTGGTTTPQGGSGGASATGGSGGAGGSSTGGASGGSTGAGGVGDTPPWREMMVLDAKRHSVKFTAKQLDPMVSDPTSHPNDMESADVDTSKPLKKKLCVVLTGIGTGPGQGIGFWAASQGYHVFSVAYSNAIGAGDGSPDAMGNTRMNQFDGGGRTPAATNTTRADSIEGRLLKAIEYLKTNDQGADWGWYLNQDGTMRWSDGCFIGYSYGATHLAVIARYVRIGLGVSTSGPQSEGHPDSTWLKIPSATPVERMWAIWGSNDEPAPTDNGYKSHYTVTTGLLGYLGDVVHTMQDAPAGTPPYKGSHRLSVDGQGHTEFCASGHPYCSYMFGL
ncbi:MAG TPA: hypothetical protein VHJ20_21940 [Polyangia bacterium]|nr:hypothetical protein [Polyangia bacterium]